MVKESKAELKLFIVAHFNKIISAFDVRFILRYLRKSHEEDDSFSDIASVPTQHVLFKGTSGKTIIIYAAAFHITDTFVVFLQGFIGWIQHLHLRN